MDLIQVAVEYNKNRSNDDPHTDSVDKFSSKYMVIYLAISAVLISADIYVGKPIECWVPEDFGKSDHVGYILDYCWLNNTRFVDPENPTYSVDNSRKITYYQWTGFILIILIGIYLTPTFVWKALHRNLDISMIRLCELAENYNIGSSSDRRQAVLNNLTSNIVNYLARQKYQRFAYIFIGIKILALICPLLAIFLLCIIFGPEYCFFAARFLYILAVEQRIDSVVFPLETMCDIKLYVQSKTSYNMYTLPCMLVNNVFTIFIFSFLNVLQWLVVAANAINLIVWLYRISYGGRKHFVGSYLYNTPVHSSDYDEDQFYKCVDILKPDGAVILHLLSSNASDFVVSAIIREMCRVEGRTRLEAVNEPDTDADEILANQDVGVYQSEVQNNDVDADHAAAARNGGIYDANMDQRFVADQNEDQLIAIDSPEINQNRG